VAGVNKPPVEVKPPSVKVDMKKDEKKAFIPP
jgi:hypothetical protein